MSVRIQELGQQEVLSKLLQVAADAGDYETYGVHISEGGEVKCSLYMKASSILEILENNPNTEVAISLIR